MVLLRRVFATGIFALVVVLAAAPAVRAQQGGEGGGSGLGTGDWGLGTRALAALPAVPRTALLAVRIGTKFEARTETRCADRGAIPNDHATIAPRLVRAPLANPLRLVTHRGSDGQSGAVRDGLTKGSHAAIADCGGRPLHKSMHVMHVTTAKAALEAFRIIDFRYIDDAKDDSVTSLQIRSQPLHGRFPRLCMQRDAITIRSADFFRDHGEDRNVLGFAKALSIDSNVKGDHERDPREGEQRGGRKITTISTKQSDVEFGSHHCGV